MALDFQNYLYSSSPPDFERFTPLYLGKRRRSPPKFGGRKFTASRHDSSINASLQQLQLKEETESDLSEDDILFEDYGVDVVGLTKCMDRRNDADRIRSWETSYNCDSTNTCCLDKKGNGNCRKVTFADAAGLALSKVRVIHETSDDPPDLGSRVMQNCVANQHTNKLTSKQPASHLVVNFSQPAASYLAFREKLMANCVSLENVVIRDNFKIVGTAKVKNIACNKAVTIRCTFDSWSSSQDFAAKPVSSEQSTFGLFVTFTFEIDVPSNVSTTHGAVQLAVCYMADGQEYWDNNNCQNYVIDVQSQLNPEQQNMYAGGMNPHMRVGSRDTGSSAKRESVYSFEPSTSWSEFAGWSDLLSESPYW